MKIDNNIKAEVEKTLNSLDNWVPIETDPFFYTRLMAKVENKKNKIKLRWFFDSPAFKPAIIAASLIINFMSIGYFVASSKNVNDQTTDFITEFTNEYYLDQSTESYLVFNDEN